MTTVGASVKAQIVFTFFMGLALLLTGCQPEQQESALLWWCQWSE